MSLYRAHGFKTPGGIGPYFYAERDGFMLHLWFRYMRDPWNRGLRWGYTLRVRDRFLLFGGRR
jgi:hypothetical protein